MRDETEKGGHLVLHAWVDQECARNRAWYPWPGHWSDKTNAFWQLEFDYGEVSSEINKCCRPTSSRHSRGPATRGELTRRDKRREVARRREALSSTARPTRLRGAPGKLLVRAREACWCKAGAQARDSAGERLRSIRDRGSIGAFSK